MLAISKSFIKPHLDYGDILYDKPNNENMKIFRTKWKNVKTELLTGGIQGTSRERLYDELSLHSLVKRHWRNELVYHQTTSALI